MRHPIVAFTTLLTTTLAISSVATTNEQPDKQAIIRAYHTIEAGFMNKDLNQIYSDHATEYTSVQPDGKVKKLEQERQELQQKLPYSVDGMGVTYEHEQIQINGQTATVLGTGHVSALFLLPNNPQVPVVVSGEFQYQDTWKRTNSGWKITNSHTLQENYVTEQPKGVQTDNTNLNSETQQAIQNEADWIKMRCNLGFPPCNVPVGW